MCREYTWDPVLVNQADCLISRSTFPPNSSLQEQMKTVIRKYSNFFPIQLPYPRGTTIVYEIFEIRTKENKLLLTSRKNDTVSKL